MTFHDYSMCGAFARAVSSCIVISLARVAQKQRLLGSSGSSRSSELASEVTEGGVLHELRHVGHASAVLHLLRPVERMALVSKRNEPAGGDGQSRTYMDRMLGFCMILSSPPEAIIWGEKIRAGSGNKSAKASSG